MLQRGLKFKKDTKVTCLFEYGQRIKTGRDILKLLDLWDSRVPMHTFPKLFCFVKGKTTTLAKATFTFRFKVEKLTGVTAGSFGGVNIIGGGT